MEENKEKLFLLNQNIDSDTRICRYMGFDVFLQLLNGKLFVPRRELFMDVRESGKKSIKSAYSFRPFGVTNNDISKEIQKEQRANKRNSRYLRQSRLLLTSCWQIDNGEDFLMWKSYTSPIGVCVRTTIGQLLSNMDYEKENLIPICSTMFYLSTYQKVSLLESVFAKDKYYQSENEFRIYFIPKDNIKDEELYSFDNKTLERIISKTARIEAKLSNKKGYSMSMFIDVKPQFINSIVLSPFIKSSTIGCFRDLLRNGFGELFPNDNCIKSSDIIVK